jgi:putative transposase
MTRKNNKRDGEYGQGLFFDSDLLKVMVEKMVKQVMEEQVREYLGVGYYQRGEQRRDQRNGYKPRTMKTRVGKLDLLVPQVRQGGWHPSIFERYQRSEKALIGAMREMVINGVSTRKVSKVLEEMCGFSVSAGTVSKTMKDLDVEIDAFNNRPLSDKNYPYLIVDARYENIRKEGMIIKCAVLVVVGVSELGQREVLGFSIGDSESEVSWGDLFGSLKRRGLSGVTVIVSDAHAGIRKAIDRHFQGASWQRCRVHFMRELANRVSHVERNEVYKDIRSVFKNDEKHVCMLVAEGVARKWSKRRPKVSKNLLEGIEDCLTTKSLPSSHEHCISSTNMLERLMRECKRRTRVVSIFPSEESCLRYVGALLIETHEEWAVEILQRKYLNFSTDINADILSGVRQI